MRVVLDPALFAPDAGHDFVLIKLLSNAVDRPHQILIDGGDAGERRAHDWITRREPVLQAPYRTLLTRGQDPSFVRQPPGVTLTVSASAAERVHDGAWATAHPTRAARLVHGPLEVLLENSINDAAFLRLTAPTGPLRQWLEGAIERDWIRFVHGGGGDLGQQLDGLGPWRRLRAWALCDAESWQPIDPGPPERYVSDQVKTFRAKAARPPAVPLFELKRRAIENYLPIPALNAWSQRIQGRQIHPRASACIQALGALDQHQARFPLRHHYHYEKGFQHKPDGVLPTVYDPFRGQPALEAGMGPQVKKIWAENLNARGTSGHWLEDAWLAADGQHPEMQRIIRSIQDRV